MAQGIVVRLILERAITLNAHKKTSSFQPVVISQGQFDLRLSIDEAKEVRNALNHHLSVMGDIVAKRHG